MHQASDRVRRYIIRLILSCIDIIINILDVNGADARLNLFNLLLLLSL